jgi:hypothetical protein
MPLSLLVIGVTLNVASREGGVGAISWSYVSVRRLSRSRERPVARLVLRICPKACDSPSKCTLIAA